ncbi:DNA methyltransferase [Acinetobacter sp. YH1901141]|uniref:DNA methyltransferase n=1 Tax=Acinetobacter sp. YH1901141 TaxID=2601201 RepID=UPI001C555ECA|nr:DNA methyltransferase [Acinetobacter sp. YH1901141]
MKRKSFEKSEIQRSVKPMITKQNRKFEELVTKLREIFQIDRPELDFGIYRILNARAGEINDYLQNRLAEKVQAALSQGGAAQQEQVARELKDKEAQYQADGIDPATVPKVQELRQKLAQYSTGASEHENAVFSHLLAFFSRYYEQGDFISQRRYKGDTYAIPYAGEEVMLHWANKDQYYTKSGENFSNYSFKLEDGRTVHFRLVCADTAKDNRKDNDKERRFALVTANTVTRVDENGDEAEEELVPVEEVQTADGSKELFIRFEYAAQPKGTKQEALVKAAVETVLDDAAVKARWLALGNRAPTEKNPQRTLLEKHLSDYTTKNTADYFIHKDLGGFLRRELDFYIKNEVMHLDDVQNAGAFADIEKNLRMIQCLRSIALELITFLAQLEDFQKKLWLKKKFVVSSHYCITLDRVPEALWLEVVANEQQWARWKQLGVWDGDAPGTLEDLKAAPYRMVDTSLFSEDFSFKLMSSIEDIDEALDGLLINSENFQAARLIDERFRKKVDLVYLDPPYNTDATPILYKNGYKDSSWSTLMAERINASSKLLTEDGVTAYAIDDTEAALLKEIVKQVNPDRDVFQCVVEHYPGSGTGRSNVSRTHEYCLFSVPKELDILRGDSVEDGVRTRGFRRAGTGDNNFRIGNPGRPESFFAVLVDKETFEVMGAEPPPQPVVKGNYPLEDTQDGLKRVYPIGENGEERVWSLSYEGGRKAIAEGRIVSSRNFVINRVYHDSERRLLLPSIWQGAQYNATTGGTNLLTAIFGDAGLFSYPKSLGTMERVLDAVLYDKDESLTLDLFGGSGTTAHAAINRNRKLGGEHKYILVEMGAHSDSVIKQRIVKVVYSANWADGKPTAPETGISHCFKVLKLESYEDTLNNLQLRRTSAQGDLLNALPQQAKDDYLLNYLLDVESRGSLLSVEDFRKPFDYTLNVAVDSAGAFEPRKIDLVETFNYLIGLRVKHIDSNMKEGYVRVEGALPSGESALVIWRDCEKIDYETLKRYGNRFDLEGENNPFDVIYINGDHNMPAIYAPTEGEDGQAWARKIRQIEPEFLERMFSVEDI